jgi:hypothetical protein
LFVLQTLIASATGSDPSAPLKSKTFEFNTIIDSKALRDTQEIELNLGDQFCGESVDVGWTIFNPLSDSIHWPRATSSCGCISSAPDSLTLEPSKSSLQFKIRFATKPESLNRQIIFWDAGGTAHLQANIKANVLSPIKLERSSLNILNDNKITQWIAIMSALDRVDLRKAQITAYAGEVIDSKFSPIDSSSGTLQLVIDPKLSGPDTTQSEVQIEVRVQDATVCQQPFWLSYVNRSTTLPKNPVFQAEGNVYRSQFIVRGAGLVRALSEKTELKAFAVAGEGKKRTQVALIVEKSTSLPDSTLSKLAITLRTDTRPADFIPERLFLQCGEWQYEFPCQFPSR